MIYILFKTNLHCVYQLDRSGPISALRKVKDSKQFFINLPGKTQNGIFSSFDRLVP